MNDYSRRMAVPTVGVELGILMCLAWLAFVSIPMALGGIGLSWDALNHHVYLGWIADKPRFDQDYRAAAGQSFQFPYLYWPFFKLFQSSISGRWAGVVLVTFNLLAVPPLWMLARACVPERSWYGIAMRYLAVILAFLSGVVLSLFDSTSNDLLAAIPLVWSVAFAIEARNAQRLDAPNARRLIMFSGLGAGAAVAFKLSNGPLAILIPLLWLSAPGGLRRRIGLVAWGSLATLGGFVLVYGYWGWLLWSHYGNPVYPFMEDVFAPIRDGLGWQQ